VLNALPLAPLCTLLHIPRMSWCCRVEVACPMCPARPEARWCGMLPFLLPSGLGKVVQYIAFVHPVTVVGQCALPTLREGGAVFCFSRFHLHVQRRLLPHWGQTKPQHRFLGCCPRAPFCCHRFGISTVCFLFLRCLCTTQTQSSVVFSLSVMPLYMVLGSMGSSVLGFERAVTGHQSVNQTGFFVCC
jgi:hypothetical protein